MGRHLKWTHVYRLYEWVEPFLNQTVAREPLPAGDRIVVLAPHIDDETIGCGGVIAKHVTSGKRVAILTFADCTPERIAEGRAAGALLGVQRQDFLPFRSKTLSGNPEAFSALVAFLREETPDLVYVPSLLDRHTDHVVLNQLLAKATRETGLQPMVYGYEVWSTLTPNVAIDITAEQPVKARALECFTSQNASNNWVEASMGLNRYRGITTSAGLYAEVFHRLTAARHRQMVSRLWKV
jgi:N-acetylglucosamine malate deacetylase 1